MKTKNEVITDVIKVIEASSIPAAVSGSIYRKTRPTNSEVEDCVVSIIPGVRGKFIYDGAMYIKIFYNDIQNDTTFSEDSKRGELLEGLLISLSDNLLAMPDYTFWKNTLETDTEAVQDSSDNTIHQHYAILKINFKYLNS